nr:Hypothetical protein 3 CDS [Astacus astacus]
MEDVALQSTMRPTGQVIVDGQSQEANFYAKPTSARPVENTEIFFKQALGTISFGPGDPRGKLLLTVELNFDHGENFRSRKLNYAYIKYSEFKLSGKRTDIVFGRSGSVGVVYTTNPWYQVSDMDPAANRAVITSDPTYRVLTISDTLDIDIMGMIQDATRSSSWYHNHPQNGMPLDYHMAGKVFLFVDNPPQALPYELPIHAVGTVQVKDFLPSSLASLTRVRQRTMIKAGTVGVLHWDESYNDWTVFFSSINDEGYSPKGSGTFVPDEPLDITFAIKATEDAETDDAPIEFHHVYHAPNTFHSVTNLSTFHFRCSISKLSNILNPMLVDDGVLVDHDITGWAIFQTLADPNPATGGLNLASIPIAPSNHTRNHIRNIAGLEKFSNLERMARGQRPILKGRPAGEVNVLDLARAHISH